MARNFLYQEPKRIRACLKRAIGGRARCLFVALLLTAFAGTQWAEQMDAQIEPKVEFVTLPGVLNDWDLKWVGQKSTIDDELSEVILQNAGEERITGFQLGWVLFIPEGCGVREAGVPRREVHLAPYREQTILPGEAVVTGPYGLSSESIRNFARRAHSPAVVAQAGIVRTRFAKQGEAIYPLEQRTLFTEAQAAYPCEADRTPAETENALKTFAGSAFSFQYASLLIPCEKKEQGTGTGYYWVQDSCSAYFPVCDDTGGQDSLTIVCVAYPKGKFADAPTFEAASFSVAAVEGASSEKDCLGGSPDWLVVPKGTGKTMSINQVTFKVFEIGEAGMSQGVGGDVYRTFHRNKCYQLSIRVAFANSGAFDGDINEFTKEDADEVRSRLEQARDSFRFLK